MAGTSLQNQRASSTTFSPDAKSNIDTTYGTSECTQLPVQDTNNAVLSRMKYEVIQFVIPMYNSETNFGLVGEVGVVPCNHVVKGWYGPDGYARVDICSCSLGLGDSRKGFELTREVICRRTKVRKTNCSGVNAAEFSQRSYGTKPAAGEKT